MVVVVALQEEDDDDTETERGKQLMEKEERKQAWMERLRSLEGSLEGGEQDSDWCSLAVQPKCEMPPIERASDNVEPDTWGRSSDAKLPKIAKTSEPEGVLSGALGPVEAQQKH